MRSLKETSGDARAMRKLPEIARSDSSPEADEGGNVRSTQELSATWLGMMLLPRGAGPPPIAESISIDVEIDCQVGSTSSTAVVPFHLLLHGPILAKLS